MGSSKSDKERIAQAIGKLTKNLTEFSELIVDVLNNIEHNKEEVKKKEKKDPNAPKRNLSSYMLYTQAVRADTVAKNPTLSPTDVAKLIGEKWRALSDKEKQPYVKQAAKEKARYEKENQVYQDGLKKKDSPVKQEDSDSSSSSEEEPTPSKRKAESSSSSSKSKKSKKSEKKKSSKKP